MSEACSLRAKTFPSRASEYGPGFRAALRVWSASHSRGAGGGHEVSIRSHRVARALAEHRRLSGVSVDGEHGTRKGDGSVRGRDRSIVEPSSQERHSHPAVQLQRQPNLVCAVRFLDGRPAAERAVRWSPAERIGAVPRGSRVRAGHPVALETPGHLTVVAVPSGSESRVCHVRASCPRGRLRTHVAQTGLFSRISEAKIDAIPASLPAIARGNPLRLAK
jgi:hypothetical protein